MKNKRNQIIRQNRLRKVERYLRRGITNQSQIAVALDISQQTISADIKEIYTEWLNSDPEQAKERRAKRIRQLEDLLAEARNGFDRSLSPEETHTEVKKPCTTCAGAGKDPHEERCITCGGKGYVTSISDTAKGRDGNPAFLKVAFECVRECARLEGVYPVKKKKIEATIKASLADVEDPYEGVPTEDLLEAYEALKRIDDLRTNTIEGTVAEPLLEAPTAPTSTLEEPEPKKVVKKRQAKKKAPRKTAKKKPSKGKKAPPKKPNKRKKR